MSLGARRGMEPGALLPPDDVLRSHQYSESPPGSTQLPACMCCRKTLETMRRYCIEQQAMGDLEMTRFECALELDPDPFRLKQGHSDLNPCRAADGEVAACACDCEERLHMLRMDSSCRLPCERVLHAPFACPQCAPPPPPPTPPSPPPPFAPVCVPVERTCCEATMLNLKKYCLAYSPKGRAVKVFDAMHWDLGPHAIPASFDMLIRKYSPPVCLAGEAERMLQLVARIDRDLCDAAKRCSLCESQCENPERNDPQADRPRRPSIPALANETAKPEDSTHMDAAVAAVRIAAHLGLDLNSTLAVTQALRRIFVESDTRYVKDTKVNELVNQLRKEKERRVAEARRVADAQQAAAAAAGAGVAQWSAPSPPSPPGEPSPPPPPTPPSPPPRFVKLMRTTCTWPRACAKKMKKMKCLKCLKCG